MPISFTLDADTNAIRTIVSGPLFDSDPVDHLARVLSHPDYRRGVSALVICRDVEIGSYSGRAIGDLVDFTRLVELELAGARVAIAAAQPVVYGLLRILSCDHSFELALFRDCLTLYSRSLSPTAP